MKTRVAFLGEKASKLGAKSETDFNKPLREYLTESLWGIILSRPGLSKKTRMLVNVAVLAATGRPDTMKRYVKAALRNGATKSEIAEVLLQITGYCGGPCGIEAFEAAQEAFKELG